MMFNQILKSSLHRLTCQSRLKCINLLDRKSVSYNLTQLSDRHLIGASGKGSYDYLQGMITNDIRHLKDGEDTSVTLDAIWAFMLTHMGRALCDLCVYKGSKLKNQDNDLILDIDKSITDGVIKYLNMYRVKRKIQFNPLENVSVWALFPTSPLDLYAKSLEKKDEEVDAMMIVKDPRLKEMGFRILMNDSVGDKKEKLIAYLSRYDNELEVKETSVNDYHRYRYSLGVSEGVIDHPPEACFPLECNADYLHGVSFHKGCYVGQELTARIHHTGVIRKRLMPVMFQLTDALLEEERKKIIGDLMRGKNITNQDGKNMGKLRSTCAVTGSDSSDMGIALLRVEEVEKANRLTIEGIDGLELKTWKPDWWPKHAIDVQTQSSSDKEVELNQ